MSATQNSSSTTESFKQNKGGGGEFCIIVDINAAQGMMIWVPLVPVIL